MKRWYVIQVYAGYEERVKADIQSLIAKGNLQDSFGEILVPSAKLRPLFEGQDSGVEDQQLFPGYVLVEMETAPEAARLVLSSPRAVKILGNLSRREIDRIQSQIKGEIELGVEKEEFNVGQEVEIADGPFAGFIGIIDMVDRESEHLTVMVSIFGRMTPVELGFHQIKQ